MGPSYNLKANPPQGVDRAGNLMFRGAKSLQSAGQVIRSVRLRASVTSTDVTDRRASGQRL